jgi:nucleoside-diphosphate-sugar epimerase
MTAARVLVTGATGVVGRLAIPQLLARGHRVTAVGRAPEKRAELTTLRADAVALDIFDAEGARRAMAGHDAVINLATHMPSSTFRMLLPWAWRENDRVRREGSAALVQAALAAGISRFIQESFAPVYEDGGASVELLSRSQRMTNAKLKGMSRWTPRWRSAREGLRAALDMLDGDSRPRTIRVGEGASL